MPCGHGGFFSLCCLGRLRRGQMGRLALSVFLERVRQSLSFERCLLCPADTGAFTFFNLGRLRGGVAKLSRQDFKRKQGRACPLRGGVCALRARGLFFFCCLGRLRGGRQMGAC